MRWIREFIRIVKSALEPQAGADDGGHAGRATKLDGTTKPFG